MPIQQDSHLRRLRVKLIVSSRGRNCASSAYASGSGRHDDGCKLYPRGAAVQSHYAEDCCSFSYPSTGAGPAGRAALVMCLYPAVFGMKKRKKKEKKTPSGNMNYSTNRQVGRQDACRWMLKFMERRIQRNSSSGTGNLS